MAWASICNSFLTNREKTLLIDAFKELYALPELLAQLDLARSSYFYHRARVKADAVGPECKNDRGPVGHARPQRGRLNPSKH